MIQVRPRLNMITPARPKIAVRSAEPKQCPRSHMRILGLMVAVPLLATIMVTVQVLYVQKLPAKGTWTYRATSADLDESLEAGPAAVR